jgi:pimeloyl-ACP methyl ester carboxylesterase
MLPENDPEVRGEQVMAKAVKAALAAGVAAIVISAGRRSMRSGSGIAARYPDFVPGDFAPQLFEAETADGITLRGKRYANQGAVPLILIAGICSNGFQYDLAFEDCNFALYFARRGYDVWVSNLRGTGREPYKSEGGDFSHCVQDKGIYDVAALVEHVTRETGKKPVLVGHSMGSVVSLVYLMGVSYREENGRVRIVPDPDLAIKHNQSVAAHVSMGGPPCFRWPRDCWHYWAIENPLTRLWLRGARAGLARLGKSKKQVPVEDATVRLIRTMPRLGPILIRIPFSFFANMRNFNRETFLETMLSGMSDISMNEAYQFVDAALSGDFLESKAILGDFPGAPHNYTRSIHLVSAPIFFVTGEKDAVNPKTVHDYGFERVSSEVKDYLCCDGYGHIDLLLGLEARRDVFPHIAAWLDRVLTYE